MKVFVNARRKLSVKFGGVIIGSIPRDWLVGMILLSGCDLAGAIDRNTIDVQLHPKVRVESLRTRRTKELRLYGRSWPHEIICNAVYKKSARPGVATLRITKVCEVKSRRLGAKKV